MMLNDDSGHPGANAPLVRNIQRSFNNDFFVCLFFASKAHGHGENYNVEKYPNNKNFNNENL